MIPLLIRALLFGALAFSVYWLLFKLIPKAFFTFTGMGIALAVIVVAFFNPNEVIPEFIWQFFIFPFKPLNLALILLAIATVNVSKTTEQKLLKFGLPVICILLVLVSMPVVSQQLVSLYERWSTNVVAIDPECNCINTNGKNQPKKARIIIVLGHQTTRINLPEGSKIQLTERGDRLLYAAQLYQEQAPDQPTIIVSAGVRNELEGEEKLRLETTEIQDLLTARGIPRDKIITDPKSSTIHNSAVQIQKLLEDKELLDQPAFLVTSAINMGRSYLTFKQLKMDVIPKPTHFYSFSKTNEALKPKLQPHDILPSVEALSLTSKVMEDLCGLLYYFMRGWLNLNFGLYLKG